MPMTKAIRCAHVVAVAATSVIAGLSMTGLGASARGIVGGALLGLVWSLLLVSLIARVLPDDVWTPRLANASIFLAIVASGVQLGGGVMYGLLMTAAVGAPTDILSSLMQPAIPFFIIVNTPMELLIVPAAVVTNWDVGRRRGLVVSAASIYYLLRIWTYLVYVPNRMAIAARPLSPGDLEWFHRTLSVDYRTIPVAVVYIAFTAAAFVSSSPKNDRPL